MISVRISVVKSLTSTFLQTIQICFTYCNLAELESIVNYNLKMVSDWRMANKDSLNIDKTNFIIVKFFCA